MIVFILGRLVSLGRTSWSSGSFEFVFDNSGALTGHWCSLLIQVIVDSLVRA